MNPTCEFCLARINLATERSWWKSCTAHVLTAHQTVCTACKLDTRRNVCARCRGY